MISKYVHAETSVSVSVFAIISLVAVICDVFYLVRSAVAPPSGTVQPYLYILAVGIIINYINNVIFLFVSKHTLLRDEGFLFWKRGNVHIVKGVQR